MIRFRRGPALVEKVIKQFTQGMAALEQAQADIDDMQMKNNEKADEAYSAYLVAQEKAYAENMALESAWEQAATVRRNLAALVGAE